MKLGRFDAAVWGVLAALALALAGLIAAGDQVGAQVVRTAPAAGEGVAALGRIGLEFDQPMRLESVSARFRLEPAVAGRVETKGNMVWFVPSEPYAPGESYGASLAAGAASLGGRITQQEIRWEFTVRAPSQVFVAPATGGPAELWRLEPGVERAPEQLTESGGKVFDFAVAPDSRHIAYSAVNDEGGMDLWLLPLEAGGSERQLVTCGPARCTVPAWSPDATRLAFSREEVGVTPEGPLGPPRVWTVAVETGLAAPLYQDSQVLGYGPTWSPDGERLAFFDGSAGGIRVVNLATSQEMVLSSWMGLVGAFSPDGQQMFYNDVKFEAEQVSAVLYLADFSTEAINVPFGDNAPWSDYGVPAWSPDGEWLAMSLRDGSDSPGKQMWLMRPNGAEARAITNAPDYTHGSYRWDPWGSALVIQRVPLGTPFPKPELTVWSADTGETRVVAVDGTLAQWLP